MLAGWSGGGSLATVRSWLSQWSLDDSRADGLACAARVRAPLLVIENSTDDAVPQPHSKMLHDAALSTDKTFHVVKGATHYYAGQPALLAEATSLIFDWLSARRMGVH
ncbi:hypothetical protein PQR75_35270 [Paraburkholderia fungorum]|uniref:hypothetical protein n=1 Tax=Paraburkholderia fungorum TaxID=134537 RepID=UPI0038BB17A5